MPTPAALFVDLFLRGAFRDILGDLHEAEVWAALLRGERLTLCDCPGDIFPVGAGGE